MPNRRFISLFFPISILILFFSGCTVNQTMTLRTDLKGSSGISILLDKFFVEYLQALAESLGGTAPNDGRAIFDLDQIALSFSVQPELDLVSLKSPSVSTLDLALNFGALDGVFAGAAPGIADVFSVTRSGGATTLKFHLDRKNFNSLAQLMPLYETGKSLYLFPDPENPMTEAEYLDYLAWAFEGAAGGTDVRAALRASVVKVRLEIRGTLVSQTGGTVSGNRVEYSIPVLRALTLEKPVDLSVTFR